MLTIHFKDGSEMEFPGGDSWKWIQAKVSLYNQEMTLVGQVMVDEFAAIRWSPDPVDVEKISSDLEQIKAGLE